MPLRSRKKRPRWRQKLERRDTGLSFIRHINWYYLKVPPKGIPGFLMAALPFVLLAGLAWTVPGFWQFLALAGVLVVAGFVILRIDWPRSVKTGFAVTVIVGAVAAFSLSGTEVGPFVLPVLAAAFALSFWRAWAIERETRERDSWRQR